MFKYLVYLRTFLSSKKGQGMVEYGLIIGLIAVVLIVALTGMTGQLKVIFQKITGELTTAAASSGG